MQGEQNNLRMSMSPGNAPTKYNQCLEEEDVVEFKLKHNVFKNRNMQDNS